ncbi:MAG: divergent polysaccharide deacetylase family protein [Desulfobacterales bacterium]|nr:divergent polysaccharide deacetylase family protein [Desulfobacterales bacterium]
MAKKRAQSKRGGRKRSRGPDYSLQTLKIVCGLCVLALLVIGAGFLAELLLDQPRVPAKAAKAAVEPKQRYRVPPVAAPAKKPVYEVFPQSSPPAQAVARPSLPERLPQIPGERPPLVAIIIDDIGYDRHIAAQLMELNVPLTFSMLPNAPFSRQILPQARAKGLEIMLHLPMEPNEYPEIDPGAGALFAHMAPDALIAQLNANLDLFSGVKGVNNHMGSRVSASSEQMRQIFSILKKRGLFYIDSRTAANTVAESSARLLQLPFAERDIFLDHKEDAAFIRNQLTLLIKRAQAQGFAVAIGHPYPATVQVLQEFLPQLKTKVSLVQASTVVEQSMLAQANAAHAAR